MSVHDGPNAGATTASGLELPVYGRADSIDAAIASAEVPGAFPFTRGIRERMYLDRPWTMRQLAGFGRASDTNARYRSLMAAGATGINGVFDYPSLRAFDSDHPLARSDVGRGGVAVDVRDDFEDLFADIPLQDVSVSLVSSQPIGAVIHLAMFVQAADRRGVARTALSGTSQNDFLMESAITIAPEALPPAGSFQLECDLIEYAVQELPRWNPVSISGYNYREAGADAVLEAALALAHAQAVAHEMIRRGHAPETFLSRISFFLDAQSDFFEEIAKFRAIRRAWAKWVRDELGVDHEPSQRFRFHVQTSGVSNTARHAHVNIARSMTQGLSAVLGGTQSLHLNGFDEAVSIPSEHAAMTALRSQYVLLHETGVAKSADPLGGSYLVEHLTDVMEQRISDVVAQIDALGGVVAATESGWVHAELARLSFEVQKAIDEGEQLIVGVNTMNDGEDVPVEIFSLPTDTLARQKTRLAEVRGRRNDSGSAASVEEVGQAARDGENVMPSILRAVQQDATLGEIGTVLRTSLGRWDFPLW